MAAAMDVYGELEPATGRWTAPVLIRTWRPPPRSVDPRSAC